METNDLITDLTKKYKILIDSINKGQGLTLKFYYECYGEVQLFCDKNNADKSLYQLHTNFIKEFLNESIKILKKASNIDFINLFNKQIDKIKLLLYKLSNSIFIYLERFYIKTNKLPSLFEKSYNLYINEFIILIKDNLFMALTDFFKEINIKDSEQNQQDIKKVIQTMNEIDELYKPILVNKNNEIIWESENNNKPSKQYKFFDEWFNNCFLKDMNSLFENKIKEIQNLPISEYITEIVNIKYQPYLMQKYFDKEYFDIILYAFNKNFLTNNKEKIEDYFINMNREQLKNFYEKNKTSKICLYLINQIFVYSIGKKV